MLLRILFGHEAVDHDGLRGSLLSDQQNGLLLLSDRLDQEVSADVVHVGNEDARVLRGYVGRVDVLSHSRVPVHPLTGVGTWGLCIGVQYE